MHTAANLTGQANHLGVTIQSDIIKQKLPERDGGGTALISGRKAFQRPMAMYLCKRLTKHSFPEIGREFSGKHHTTVTHSVDKIILPVNEDRNFHGEVTWLIDNLCS